MDSSVRQQGSEGGQAILPDLLKLVEGLPPIVSAEALSNFMLGIYTKKTLSNMRHAGKGPKSFKIGRKVATTPQYVAAWLSEQMKPFSPDA